ncbi:hypothetical protein [Salipiger abyssi]|uniref:hypothetical protein n=1 Tax=Salipiger abyssi TaxID=1250539 RepID=UPI0040583FEE
MITETDTQTLTLSADTHALSIRYYGKPTRADPPRWTEPYDGQGLPKLAKVAWRDAVGVAQVPVVVHLSFQASFETRSPKRSCKKTLI